MYYLQHERPCCIGRYKLEPKARVCMSNTMGRQMSFYYLVNFPYFLSLFISLFKITNS